ncbi:hypothetical protein C8R46DRAFT_1202741 [Mycena filopes]|nr:hypothetical protein C8R46DRAFT_1202741 [Mycena filopes]
MEARDNLQNLGNCNKALPCIPFRVSTQMSIQYRVATSGYLSTKSGKPITRAVEVTTRDRGEGTHGKRGSGLTFVISDEGWNCEIVRSHRHRADMCCGVFTKEMADAQCEVGKGMSRAGSLLRPSGCRFHQYDYIHTSGEQLPPAQDLNLVIKGMTLSKVLPKSYWMTFASLAKEAARTSEGECDAAGMYPSHHARSISCIAAQTSSKEFRLPTGDNGPNPIEAEESVKAVPQRSLNRVPWIHRACAGRDRREDGVLRGSEFVDSSTIHRVGPPHQLQRNTSPQPLERVARGCLSTLCPHTLASSGRIAVKFCPLKAQTISNFSALGALVGLNCTYATTGPLDRNPCATTRPQRIDAQRHTPFASGPRALAARLSSSRKTTVQLAQTLFQPASSHSPISTARRNVSMQNGCVCLCAPCLN